MGILAKMLVRLKHFKSENRHCQKLQYCPLEIWKSPLLISGFCWQMFICFPALLSTSGVTNLPSLYPCAGGVPYLKEKNLITLAIPCSYRQRSTDETKMCNDLLAKTNKSQVLEQNMIQQIPSLTLQISYSPMFSRISFLQFMQVSNQCLSREIQFTNIETHMKEWIYKKTADLPHVTLELWWIITSA